MCCQLCLNFVHLWSAFHLSHLSFVLEAFDNKDLDLRTPLEWLALGTNPDTGRYEKPLPVLALWRDPENGVGHWRRAVVMQYDSRVEKFEIQYEDWVP